MRVPETTAGILDGVTIRGESAEGSEFPDSSEGGILIEINAGLQFRACSIIACEANNLGGGIYNTRFLSSEDSLIDGNRSNSNGGETANGGVCTILNPTIIDNDLVTGQILGGSIYELDGTLELVHSTITGNRAGNFESGAGGGLHLENGLVSFHNCIFAGNISPFGPDLEGVSIGAGNSTLVGSDPMLAPLKD